ncbi:hypothetical protein AA23498_3536 [Acetobacter nitrogenifigens DSM 23921 = NBRC 105050]|nr:hypothetical protein AA23498_3536 [Acetobacter nitrogenifigens DSM 23921 = NBRC 105050]
MVAGRGVGNLGFAGRGAQRQRRNTVTIKNRLGSKEHCLAQIAMVIRPYHSANSTMVRFSLTRDPLNIKYFTDGKIDGENHCE